MSTAGRAVQYRRDRSGRAALVGFARSLQRAFPVCLLCFLTAVPADSNVVVLIERGASIYWQAERGFEEGFAGKDKVDVSFVRGDSRELSAKIEALRKAPPRLVVAIGTQAAIAAKSRLHDVPILYCLALNPVQNELVGPNVGGVTLDVDLFDQLAGLEKVVPHVKRIGVIYNELVSGNLVRQARTTLRPGVQLIARDAANPLQALTLIEEVLGQVDAFWLLWDPVIANGSNFRRLVDLSLKNKVALIAPAPPFVEAGALMSVSADYEKAGQRTGEMARLILEGGRAGDFRAEPPRARVITINASVARQLGISIPPTLQAEVLAAGISPDQAPEGPKK